MVLQPIDLIRKRISDIRKRCKDPDEIAGITLAHFTSVFKVPTQHWNSIISASKNILMSAPYMAGMEQHPYRGMLFHYLIAYRDTEPIGVIYLQETDIEITNVDQKVDTEKVGTNNNSIFSKAKGLVSSSMELLKVRMLVAGNLYMSGKPSFQFLPDIDLKTQAAVLSYAVDRVMADNISGKKIRAILVKDISPALETEMSELDDELTRFEVQPNMVVNLRPHWNSIDDVLADYSSKYRVRAKKAMKMLGHIEHRELSEDDLEKYGPRIMEIFKEVEDKADFSMVSIHPRYFLDLKIAMEDRFKMFGYFDEDKLVSFYSFFRGEKENLSSFVGMDYNYNKPHYLYQNMLYHYIEDAVADKVERLDLTRTALEIKSTVGAEPEIHRLMIKHTNTFTNAIVRRFIKNIKQVEWVQRRPFKDQKVNAEVED